MTCFSTARLRTVCHRLLTVILVLWATYTTAQTTGTVRGTVSDRNGQPVPGATVSVAAPEGPRETSTDGAGHFEYTGLSPGHYSVTAEKDTIGGQVFRVLVQPGGSVDVTFVLEPGRTPAPWLRALPRNRAGAEAFEAGVRANRAGDLEEAIAHFEAALGILPTCVDCHFNIGVAYGRLDRFDEAEAAFRDALRIRSDFGAAYYGLADIYSRQNRLEEAASARGEATRIAVRALEVARARAQDTLARGVAFWNSDNVEDAVRQFEMALEIDSTLLEPYYWLGMAYETRGDPDAGLRAFARYLTAPDGEHAADAKRRLDALER